jgi:hypothetical protein
MKWKKKECLQQKIDAMDITEKNTGQIEMLICMWAVFVIALMMIVSLKIAAFMIAGAYVEDALAASNLASALIDVEEYGKTRVIRIEDTERSFLVYKEALAVNLCLDENARSFQQELLKGEVRLKEYIVYNVNDDVVEMIKFVETGQTEQKLIGKHGEVYTPDGTLIETTTVYSKVEFGVPGLGGQYIYAEKEKSVDVKNDENK